MEQYIVSARKYRPQTFDTVVDQDNIVTTLKNAIRRRQLANAYLFCGPRGVGKTTCARIFAKAINCLNPTSDMEACGTCESCKSFAEGRSYCIHELDAASNNSVEDIRELIDKARIPPQIGKYSVYIIDEVHMLSQAAFNAFLKTLEEPPAYAIFILATTEKHKVLPTILSRCQSFDFNRISIKGMVRQIRQVAQQEGVAIGEDACHVIAQRADGAMRDALTLLDRCIAISGKEIQYEDVLTHLNVLNYDYYFRLIDMALQGSYDKMLVLLDEILAKGFNALHFIGGLSRHFRDLLVCSQRGSIQLLEFGESIAARYKAQATACTPSFLIKGLTVCSAAEIAYKTSGNPRLQIELALISLSQIMTAPVQQAEQPSVPASGPVTPPKKANSQPLPPSQPAMTPASQSAMEPAPQPIATDTLGTEITIKGLMKGATKKQEKQAAPIEIKHEQQAFSQEALEEAWSRLVQEVPARLGLKAGQQQRFATALAAAEPQLGDPWRVSCSVANVLQKDWIEHKCLGQMQSFLHQALHNDAIQVEVVVTEKPDDGKPSKLYMPQEKARFMLQQFPETKKLQEDLDLELQ